jgi:hypothetical protein
MELFGKDPQPFKNEHALLKADSKSNSTASSLQTQSSALL